MSAPHPAPAATDPAPERWYEFTEQGTNEVVHRAVYSAGELADRVARAHEAGRCVSWRDADLPASPDRWRLDDTDTY